MKLRMRPFVSTSSEKDQRHSAPEVLKYKSSSILCWEEPTDIVSRRDSGCVAEVGATFGFENNVVNG